MEMKICKQCGMLKSIEEFRKYIPRGNGVRNTKQGSFIVCRSCEKLARDVKAVLDKGETNFDGLRVMFLRPGWQPVLKPIRIALGLEEDRPRENPSVRIAEINKLAGATRQGAAAYMEKLVSRSFDGPDEGWDRLRDVDGALREWPLEDYGRYSTDPRDDYSKYDSDTAMVYEYATDLLEAWEDEYDA